MGASVAWNLFQFNYNATTDSAAESPMLVYEKGYSSSTTEDFSLDDGGAWGKGTLQQNLTADFTIDCVECYAYLTAGVQFDFVSSVR